MQKKFFLLLSIILFTAAINAADAGLDKTQLAAAVAIMKKENRTVSPDDSFPKRTVRNFHRCATNPCNFIAAGMDFKIADYALVEYVMDKELTINRKNILSPEAPVALQMREAFEKDQREAIREYLDKRLQDDNTWGEAGACAVSIVTNFFLLIGAPMVSPACLCLGATSCTTCIVMGFGHTQ